jgi:hypothetical protein
MANGRSLPFDGTALSFTPELKPAKNPRRQNNRETMRKLLYSKWYFLLLAVISLVNLLADVMEEIWGWNFLNKVAIPMDAAALFLSVWMFADLHSRRPDTHDHPGGRR